MGITVDGNGNNPSSHGKNHHGFFVVVDLEWAYPVSTPVTIPQYNEDFVTQYYDNALVGLYRLLNSAYRFNCTCECALRCPLFSVYVFAVAFTFTL